MKQKLKRFILDRSNQEEYLTEHDAEDGNPIDMIHEMVLPAAKVMEQILDNPRTPEKAQIMLIDMILNRTYGAPKNTIQIDEDAEAEKNFREAEEAIAEMVAEIQQEMREEEERRKQNTQTLEHSNTPYGYP